MDEKQDHSDNLKVFIRALKKILDNGQKLSLIEYKNLIEQYQLTESEITRLEELALKQYADAESHYDLGNWDICLKTIEESAVKSPFNKKILLLHIKTLNECIKFSEENTYYQEQKELVLLRLKMVDKKSYALFGKKPIKISNTVIVLIPLLVISSALFLLLYNPTENYEERAEEFSPPTVEGIIVEHRYNIPYFDPTITIVENEIKQYSGTFQYNLKLLLSSESYNISKLQGVINLYDRDNHLLVSTPFSSHRGHKYFKSEDIPIAITLNSLRAGPDIRRVILVYDTIEKSKSQERENLKPLILKDNIYNKLSISEYNNNRLRGVNSNYMEWEVVINNSSNQPIEHLNGVLEWYDDNQVVISSLKVELMNSSNIPIMASSKRFIYKLLELPEEITDNYRLRIIK